MLIIGACSQQGAPPRTTSVPPQVASPPSPEVVAPKASPPPEAVGQAAPPVTASPAAPQTTAPPPAPAPLPSTAPSHQEKIAIAGSLSAPPKPAAFTWPPPPASAETEIPAQWIRRAGQPTTLGSVAERLEQALKDARYQRWSYLSVPNGFALVAQMEQIRPDGTPSPEPARWSTNLPRAADLNLYQFIRALANAEPGYYRVIVFVVTDQPWSRTGARPTSQQAEHWLATGDNYLPPAIGALPYEPGFRTTGLVYEFKKASQKTDATFIDTSPTRAEDHLSKAGISERLSH